MWVVQGVLQVVMVVLWMVLVVVLGVVLGFLGMVLVPSTPYEVLMAISKVASWEITS